MTTSFDFHDTISVIVPGACALGLFYLFYSEDWAAFWAQFKSLPSGGTLFLLLPCYAVGELLQALGKWAVKYLIYPHCGGDPYHWVLKEQDDPTSNYTDFLPIESCQKVQGALKREFGWETVGKDELSSAFYHVKITVYSDDVNRQECIKMLTKLHLFSGLLVLCVLTPFVYIALALSSGICDTVTYCFEHDAFTFKQACHYSWASFFVICFLCATCGIGMFKCTLEFSRSYNRCLYSSYLAVLRREEEKANA